jgi:hypothetical protein
MVGPLVIKTTMKINFEMSLWQAIKLRIAGFYKSPKQRIALEQLLNGEITGGKK